MPPPHRLAPQRPFLEAPREVPHHDAAPVLLLVVSDVPQRRRPELPHDQARCRARGRHPGCLHHLAQRYHGAVAGCNALRVLIRTLTPQKAQTFRVLICSSMLRSATWSRYEVAAMSGAAAAGAIVPGLLSLLLIPWIIYKLDPPELLKTPEAPGIAARKLEARINFCHLLSPYHITTMSSHKQFGALSEECLLNPNRGTFEPNNKLTPPPPPLPQYLSPSDETRKWGP